MVKMRISAHLKMILNSDIHVLKLRLIPHYYIQPPLLLLRWMSKNWDFWKHFWLHFSLLSLSHSCFHCSLDRQKRRPLEIMIWTHTVTLWLHLISLDYQGRKQHGQQNYECHRPHCQQQVRQTMFIPACARTAECDLLCLHFHLWL